MFVTTNWSIGAFSMRSIAGPDSTPCTAHAMIRAAPFFFNAPAAHQIRYQTDFLGRNGDEAAAGKNVLLLHGYFPPTFLAVFFSAR